MSEPAMRDAAADLDTGAQCNIRRAEMWNAVSSRRGGCGVTEPLRAPTITDQACGQRLVDNPLRKPSLIYARGSMWA